MKAVIFIERDGTRGRINECMKVTVTKEGRKVKSFPIPWPMIYLTLGIKYLGWQTHGDKRRVLGMHGGAVLLRKSRC